MDPILMHSDWMQLLREKLPDTSLMPDPDLLPDALRYYLCDGAIEGGVKCDQALRNYVCYVENDDIEGRSSATVGSNVCRDHKFLTKPIW